MRYPATGTGQHVLHLFSALIEQDRENQYVLLGPGPRVALDSLEQWRLAARRLQAHPTASALRERAQRLWWEQLELPRAARAARVDLLHCPYFAAPLLHPAPTVVTIHDVITLLLPAYRERWINRAYTALVAAAARRAAAIITVSECSRRDIARKLGIGSERIHVIGNGVEARFHPVTDPEQLAAVRARYDLPERFVLYLGGFDIRKNLRGLVRAFARLPGLLRAQYPLVIAGRPHLRGHPLYPDPRPLVEELGLGDCVRFVGEVEQADSPAVYSAATVFAWPSLYEGFGIPVLEAMACGTPVLTSNRSALPELVGEAARLVDPQDVEAIAAGLAELLEHAALRQELRERGLRRAAAYTWQRAAAETLAVYRAAVAAAGGAR